MQTQKIDAEKWGAKVIEQISTDLQKQHWGLKRFSYRNLMKMKQFLYRSSTSFHLAIGTGRIGKI